MLDRQSIGGAETTKTDRLLADPVFQRLVRERTAFAWTMSLLMLAIYLAFILLSAFGKSFMASAIGTSSISWGILLGFLTIVAAFALTGLYVARANGRYDALTAQIREDAR